MMTDYANNGTKNGMVQFKLTNLGIPYDEPQVNAVRSTYRSRGSPPGRRYIRGASRARQKHRSGYVGMAGRTRRVVLGQHGASVGCRDGNRDRRLESS